MRDFPSCPPLSRSCLPFLSLPAFLFSLLRSPLSPHSWEGPGVWRAAFPLGGPARLSGLPGAARSELGCGPGKGTRRAADLALESRRLLRSAATRPSSVSGAQPPPPVAFGPLTGLLSPRLRPAFKPEGCGCWAHLQPVGSGSCDPIVACGETLGLDNRLPDFSSCSLPLASQPRPVPPAEIRLPENFLQELKRSGLRGPGSCLRWVRLRGPQSEDCAPPSEEEAVSSAPTPALLLSYRVAQPA